MKKILVPIDFSDSTWSVCRYAVMVAGNEPAEIHLFHSYFDQIIVTDSSFPTGIDTESMINEQLLQDIKQRSEQDILDLQQKLIDYLNKVGNPKSKVIFSIEGGEPEYEILEMEEEYNPDLIVMGTRGTGAKGFLEGSVSRKIMNNAPVFAIPDINKLPDIAKVAYLSEITEVDIPVIETIMSLLGKFNSTVFYLHFLLDDDREKALTKLNPIQKHFADQERDGLINYNIIPENDIHEDIENFIRSKDISLIAFIPHKKGFFKRLFFSGISKKDLLQTNMPLLAIPEQ